MIDLTVASQESSSTRKSRPLVYALVGNPNAGKTTLFNHLTGLKQKVANYAGVTVEVKVGTCFSQHGQQMEIIDLPGAYSLSAQSPDEAILQQALLGRIPGKPKPDRILCIVDGSNLERNLFLAAQVAELGHPTILVINMMDIVRKRGIFIDTGRIEKELGVTVITTQAHKKEGLVALKLAMSRTQLSQPHTNTELPNLLTEAILSLQSCLLGAKEKNLCLARGEALLLLCEGADEKYDKEETVNIVTHWRERLNKELPNWKSLVITSRYRRIGALCNEALFRKEQQGKTATEYIDEYALGKFWGWIILVGVMCSLFWSIFTLAEYPMSAIEGGFEYLGELINNFLPNGPIKGLIVNGLISGVGSVAVFLPQIFLLFLFIGLLESSGYLPRAAFILDRPMSKVGLQGKAFIPLLSSYACAVPAILSTRTLGSKEERLATIMIAPWMSCSARLPVYLLMIATLIPENKATSLTKSVILLAVYAVGTIAAMAAAWIFRKTLFKGKPSGSIMELPEYRAPSWKNIIIEVNRRSWMFIKRAGSVILGCSIILWFLSAYPQSPDMSPPLLEESYMGMIGKFIEPTITPLGYDWKIGIGLLSSFAARELFVSTIAIVYNTESTLLSQSLANAQIFTPLTCCSLMIFFIFAMQCMSTLAVTYKETKSLRWPLLQFVYMTGFAYIAAFIVFQGGKLLGLS